MSLRVIAGEYRGVPLHAPAGLKVRPTQGKVRLALFNILSPRLPGARVLDLFAGSGSLGIEALSRGAAEALFIEQARPALDALRANLDRLAAGDRAAVVAGDALRLLARPEPPAVCPFDIILLDPPYNRDLAAAAMERLGAVASGWLAPGGVVVAQADRRDAIAESYGALGRFRSVDYGDTTLSFFSMRVPQEPGESAPNE